MAQIKIQAQSAIKNQRFFCFVFGKTEQDIQKIAREHRLQLKGKPFRAESHKVYI